MLIKSLGAKLLHNPGQILWDLCCNQNLGESIKKQNTHIIIENKCNNKLLMVAVFLCYICVPVITQIDNYCVFIRQRSTFTGTSTIMCVAHFVYRNFKIATICYSKD